MEYRDGAARLMIDSDRTIAEAIRELGVGEQLLGRWVRAEPECTGVDELLSTDERAEPARLRREVSALRLSHEFSGTTVFFASKSLVRRSQLRSGSAHSLVRSQGS